ncbi:MAG: iron ABC transporter permease [Deltaproteobacteria bacterium]|nr:iron ABC transporter permease [Deltaproteobacteria bacterium]
MDNYRSPLSLSQLRALALLLAMLTLVAAFLCSFSGPISVVENAGWCFWQSIIWQGRVTRIIAAGLVGGGLSIAGLALQALLRNPLADPYILGISSGAGVGVIFGLSLAARTTSVQVATIPTLAFVGAVTTCAVVYAVAQQRGNIDPYSLILSGVMINSINTAIIVAVYLFIDPHTLTSFVGWSIGQVPDTVAPDQLLFCGICIIGACVYILLRGAAYNTLGLGDGVAATSGVPIRRLRIETFVCAGLVTACAVSMVGPVGFLGLFIPHICRMVFGPDHRRLAVVCGFVGAMFLILCDTFCRYISIAADLGGFPVGIVTAFLGGPFFIWLLRGRRRTRLS